MPLDIAWSFFGFFFLAFFFIFGWFYYFFLIYFITFLGLFITAGCFTYGFHTACETLDALSVVIQASTLPLLPFTFPIAVGSVLAVWSAALACCRIFPELVGISLEHCC